MTRLTILALCLLFCACGEDDVDRDIDRIVTPQFNENTIAPMDYWIGAWRIVSQDSKSGQLPPFEGAVKPTHTFNKDGTWTELGRNSRGEYILSGVYIVFGTRYIIRHKYLFYPDVNPKLVPDNPSYRDKVERGSWSINGDILILIDDDGGNEILRIVSHP